MNQQSRERVSASSSSTKPSGLQQTTLSSSSFLSIELRLLIQPGQQPCVKANYLCAAQIICVLPKLSVCCPNYLCTAQIICVLPKLSVYCPNYLCTAQTVCVLPKLSVYCPNCLCTAQTVCVLPKLSVYCPNCLCTAQTVCVLPKLSVYCPGAQLAMFVKIQQIVTVGHDVRPPEVMGNTAVGVTAAAHPTSPTSCLPCQGLLHATCHVIILQRQKIKRGTLDAE
jgi:hypothetical protein